MDDQTSREMTLKEWCARLPENHLVNKQLKGLLESEAFLNALLAAGVDNWDGYDYAVEMLEQ